MVGQYTNDEMLGMSNITTCMYWILHGLIIRELDNGIIKYYEQHYDGSWTKFQQKSGLNYRWIQQ